MNHGIIRVKFSGWLFEETLSIVLLAPLVVHQSQEDDVGWAADATTTLVAPHTHVRTAKCSSCEAGRPGTGSGSESSPYRIIPELCHSLVGSRWHQVTSRVPVRPS
jgi:hypothetical protein